MFDFMIFLGFIALVVSPAIVAAKFGFDEDENNDARRPPADARNVTAHK